MNIKRFQGLAQALFPPDSFLPTPSSTHIRQQWFNLKNMARRFQTAVDHLSEEEAGREKGWEEVCGARLARVHQAQKRGQALCWVQGDSTRHSTAPSRQSWGETGPGVYAHDCVQSCSPTLLLPTTQSPHAPFWGLN